MTEVRTLGPEDWQILRELKARRTDYGLPGVTMRLMDKPSAA